MNHPTKSRLFSCAALGLVFAACSVFAACNGGGNGTSAAVPFTGSFLVVKTEPANNGRLYLNDPIRIDFTTLVDLSTANLNTVSFQVLDQTGTPLAEQPMGTFALDTSPGDTIVGRRLMFVPRFPTNDTYDNGGFRPGRTYLVQLVGGDSHNGNVLKDQNGKGLASPVTFRFSTADGTTPSQLFRDTVQGGPAKVDFQVAPINNKQSVPLNKFGAPPIEFRLVFNQPLNPASANVPVTDFSNALTRSINNRGRIYLEYDDSDPSIGINRWIPAQVELEANDLTHAVVALRPVGVLPNNASVRVIVENTLEDISGESNVANAAYARIFDTCQTQASFEPQFNAIVEEFATDAAIDYSAAFLEPQAEVDAGFVKASFPFEGTPTTLEYQPNVSEVVLNTDFTQIVPSNGTPFNVSGGIFNFRNVTIPAGVRVRGTGSQPMVWLVSGDITVNGDLTVRGGDGDRVNTLNSANYPSAGGVGVCTGGNGGRGSPSGTARDIAGESGFGPNHLTGGGGRGGLLSCNATCGIGSGGGGGSMSTQGDPHFKSQAQPGTSFQQRRGVGGSMSTQGDPHFKSQAQPGTSFQQRRGVGGQGCPGSSGAATRTLAGGDAGPLQFTDARSDNDFWGSAVNVFRQIRITGELATPIGGEGGGGGGDLSSGGCTVNDPGFINDAKGGGGGGGGGVLIIKALGTITVGPSGHIIADGGNGGGGEPAGSCQEGGGGGGGAGGMVILMAGRQIVINVHGTSNHWLYGADNDYNFAVSADGGVCCTGTYGSPDIEQKYAASGTAPPPGPTYDSFPLGAFGGMGVVQLMAPPGDPTNPTNADGTNTVLDDNIVVIEGSTTLQNAAKQNVLAWRGFPNAQGQLVDDTGNALNIGDNEGDIRPAPLLMPVPFSTRTRVRSQWIDTGASVRRALTSADNNPRGIVEDTGNGYLSGPTYEFAGTSTVQGAPNLGYANYTSTGGGSVRLTYPAISIMPSPVPVISMALDATFQGDAAYQIEVPAGSMGPVVDRYTQYEAELLNAQSTVLTSYRILTHTDRILTLSPESGPMPSGVTQVIVRSKFFKIVTSGAEGLGPTYVGASSQPVPVANVRIGFAFHQNPASSTALRFPASPTQFVFDLTDPTTQETIRTNHMSYVMWDVVFDSAFKTSAADVPPSLSPTSPRPELHFLRIPFRF